jgi:secondary thiamine-phosphate synthase enzyme
VETIRIKTAAQVELIDITNHVQKAVQKLEISDGICYVQVPHTTAGLTVNENADPTVRHDVIMALNRMVPDGLPYQHQEGNSPAHIKASLFGTSTAVLVSSGQLALGTWQGIYFCEFDGPRARRIFVTGLASKG